MLRVELRPRQVIWGLRSRESELRLEAQNRCLPSTLELGGSYRQHETPLKKNALKTCS